MSALKFKMQRHSGLPAAISRRMLRCGVGPRCRRGVNFLLNSKHAPVGGTSAGLAVLSQFIYTGAIGSVTSSQALANPFHRYVTLDRDLFQSSLGGNKLYAA